MSWLIVVSTTLAAGFLAAAGAVMLARPLPTARAMYAAGLPGSAAIARAIGAVEAAVGAWFLLAPSTPAALALAAVYLAFAGFVGWLLVAHPEASSCGCAGATDVPPSALHAVMNALAGFAALAAAAAVPPSLVDTMTSLGFAAVPFAIGLATAAALAVVAVTDLPPALAAFRKPAGHPVEADGDRHARADAALASVGVGPLHPSLWPGVDPGELSRHGEDARG